MARNLKIASVVVDLTADSTRYIKELVDVNKETQRWSKEISRSFTRVTRNLAVATGGFQLVQSTVSAVMGQMSKSLQHAKEIEILSNLAGQSVEEFQAAAYAANQYGISAEKLGDISKDVSDKLGSFILNGGGEFKDFFDKIAPSVGITAEQLQGLSGPEVLLKVKKAMEDANVPMTQQIALLEGISDDAAKLIPLLENGGEQYHLLTEEAHKANVVLSETDISALRESEKILDKVGSQVSVSFAKGVAGASKQIQILGNSISFVFENLGVQLDSWSNDPQTMAGIIERGRELKNELDSVNKSIGRLERNKGSYNRDSQLAALRAKAVGLNSEITTLEQKRKSMEKNTKDKGGNNLSKIGPTELIPSVKLDKGISDETNKIINDNQRIVDSLSQKLLSREQLLEISYKKEQEKIRSLVLTESQLRELGYQTNDELEKEWLRKSEENHKKSMDDIKNATSDKNKQIAESLFSRLATENEKLKKQHDIEKQQIESLVLTDVQARMMGFESIDSLQKAWLERSNENHKTALENLKTDAEDSKETFSGLANLIGVKSQDLETAAVGWVNSFGDELANMVTKGEMDFSRLANSIMNQILRLTIQAAIVDPLLDSFKLGKKALGGPVNKESTYLVGENGPRLFTASNSSNMLPQHRLGGTGSIVNIYTQPGETAETRTRPTEGGDIIEVFMKQVDSRINEQISRGQGLARTLEGRYALSRKSY